MASTHETERNQQALATTLYTVALTYWYSTIPHTTSLDVFWVFVILDVIWGFYLLLKFGRWKA